MKIKVKVYDNVKYLPESKKITEIEFDIESMEIKTLTDEEIYNMGFDTVDEYKEYCFLTFADGSTSSFRNSHIDIFRV